MTSGGGAGTSGGGRARRFAWLAFAAVGLVDASVNAISVGADLSRLGRAVQEWEPWTWELTSFAAWLLLAPLIFAATERLRPPRLRWPAALAAHAFLSALASLAHVALMMGLRALIYAAAGGAYRPAGALLDILLYEYRKDLFTYAVLALLVVLMQRLLARPAAQPDSWQDSRIEVRDGSRTVWLAPADIDWAQSAGNYVELHGRFGSRLHRETLAALAERLELHGFRRIHRSRLVRSAAVAEVETRPSGDFEVTLQSGERLAGSRRFRARMQN